MNPNVGEKKHTLSVWESGKTWPWPNFQTSTDFWRCGKHGIFLSTSKHCWTLFTYSAMLDHETQKFLET